MTIFDSRQCLVSLWKIKLSVWVICGKSNKQKSVTRSWQKIHYCSLNVPTRENVCFARADMVFLSKSLASLTRNYFPKRPSDTSLHTLSKLYDVPVGFVTPHLGQYIALFAVAEGWLLLHIGRFVLFFYKQLHRSHQEKYCVLWMVIITVLSE